MVGLGLRLDDALPYSVRTKHVTQHLIKCNNFAISAALTEVCTRLNTILVTLHASCGAVYCNRSCLWVCDCVVCLWVCYHDNSKLHASILTKTGFVGKGSDHLQLVKFWPSHAPGEGGLQRDENFWLRLTTASAQCLHLLWAFSFHWNYHIVKYLCVLPTPSPSFQPIPRRSAKPNCSIGTFS